jgi:hypothetical protein
MITAVVAAGLMQGTLGARASSLSGAYVEARTAEVFAGACVMNGEAGTTGKEALLAWKVDRGSFKGVALDGLSVVAAVSGDVNLGVREIGGETATTRTALFIDERATPMQRAALVAMARQLSNGVIGEVVQLSGTKIAFVEDGHAVKVSAESLRLNVAKHMHHEDSCGGKQWFHPLSKVDDATLGTATENAFSGAALGTKWSDPNKRSGFVGTFSY